MLLVSTAKNKQQQQKKASVAVETLQRLFVCDSILAKTRLVLKVLPRWASCTMLVCVYSTAANVLN